MMLFMILYSYHLLNLFSCEDSFSYEPHELSNWNGICSTGIHQSPIDINKSQTYPSSSWKILLRSINSLPKRSEFYHAHHTFLVKLYYNLSHFPSINLLRDNHWTLYVPYQVHIHFPPAGKKFESEHHIDNIKQPLGELHLVTYNLRHQNFSKAVNYTDGILVIASVIVEGSNENDFVKALANKVTEVDSETNKSFSYIFQFYDFLPHMNDSGHLDFFMYSGSLTTPNCDEVVTWLVSQNPMMVSLATMNIFKTHKDEKEYGDIRPVQNINNRTIYTITAINDVKNSTIIKGANNSTYEISFFNILFHILNFSTSLITIRFLL